MPDSKDLREAAKPDQLVHPYASSNGNRENLAPGESNDAQLGGPDLKKAQERMPPDAEKQTDQPTRNQR